MRRVLLTAAAGAYMLSLGAAPASAFNMHVPKSLMVVAVAGNLETSAENFGGTPRNDDRMFKHAAIGSLADRLAIALSQVVGSWKQFSASVEQTNSKAPAEMIVKL